MELFVNDLSLHRQYPTAPAFLDAFGHLMGMRKAARRHGREVYCHRMLANAQPAPGMTMQQALRGLGQDTRRAAMRWLTRGGPFWDDPSHHGPDDYIECRGEIVTDSAIGEAAYRRLHDAAYRTLHDAEYGLVSFAPSDWTCSPIKAVWRREAEARDNETATIENWWDAVALERGLRDAPPPIGSWAGLREVSTNRFDRLTFAGDCFEPLDGVPFAKSAADRLLALLGILERLAHAFDADGARTSEGHRIYQDHFTGDKAPFSDSSVTEQHNFRRQLTFAHPDDPDDSLFCTWHGKVHHMTLRLHFSWPIAADRPVYVVYAGPKITRL